MMRKAAGAVRRAWDAMAGLAMAAFVAVQAGIPAARAVTIGDLADEASSQFDSIMELAQWIFYALAVFVGGWAILRFKSHLDNPQRGGLGQPVGGILVAVALASAPALIDAFVEGFGLDTDPGLRKPRFESPSSGSPPGGT